MRRDSMQYLFLEREEVTFPGDYSEEVTPVLIPNTEVKLLCGDGTVV